MKVYVNNKNDIINFVTDEYGYDPKDLKEVKGYDPAIEKRGLNINDKDLDGVNRYYIDKDGVVQRRSDNQIKNLKEYKDKKAAKDIEAKVAKEMRKLALKSLQMGAQGAELVLINKELDKLEQ